MAHRNSGSSREARLSLRQKNRSRAWEWSQKLLDTGISIWRLEWLKASVALADDRLISLPSATVKKRSVVSILRLLLGIASGFIIAYGYILLRRGGGQHGKLPASSTRIAAVHAEWSTRTRHLLSALDNSKQPVNAIILLGRLHRSNHKTLAIWRNQRLDNHSTSTPLVHPMSPSSCISALRDLPRLLVTGMAESKNIPLDLPFREHAAIAFRVVLGAVAARWWAANGLPRVEVYFAITGTADTTLLEKAIQKKGGRTVHVLHGQATGPNFLGHSDLAFFRSLYDAKTYSRLGCYGSCAVQCSSLPSLTRGNTGLLLLSNLAHPMNPDFRRRPLQDELTLLACVGAAARKIGSACLPLFWKPHPVLKDLTFEERSVLRAAASKEGFTELPAESDAIEVAAGCRWVLSTPSTVALDLLQAGCLSIILDPQGSVLDTALTKLPIAPVRSGAASVAAFLEQIDDENVYSEVFWNAFNMVRPARIFDMSSSYIEVEERPYYKRLVG